MLWYRSRQSADSGQNTQAFSDSYWTCATAVHSLSILSDDSSSRRFGDPVSSSHCLIPSIGLGSKPPAVLVRCAIHKTNKSRIRVLDERKAWTEEETDLLRFLSLVSLRALAQLCRDWEERYHNRHTHKRADKRSQTLSVPYV